MDETFPDWIDSQLRATGIAPAQIVFELRLDNLASGFTIGGEALFVVILQEVQHLALYAVQALPTTCQNRTRFSSASNGPQRIV